jgi:hypothetical protein
MTVYRLRGWILTTILVVGAATAPRVSAADPTEELLAVVPPNMSGLVILEDLSGHYQRLLESETYEHFSALPIVQEWQKSPEFQAFRSAQALMPFYFGVNLTDLRDNIIGDSLVLAFRPGQHPGMDDVGLLLARARSEDVLHRLIRTVTKPVKGRDVEKLTYRDVPYFKRLEATGRVDFICQLGSIGILCGQDTAMKEVIDTFKDGNGIGRVDVFREMRDSLPDKCLAQFLLSPRGFDEQVRQALASGTAEDRVWSKFLGDFWTSIRWTALSLRFTDNMQLGWHLAVNDEELPEIARPWAQLGKREGNFLENVPADAIGMLAGEVDFPAAWQFFLGTVPEDASQSIHQGVDLFEQLLGGYRGKEDLLPRLGPEFGMVVTEGESGLEPRLIASIPIEELQKEGAGQISLTMAFEHALQAALVMYGYEHNVEMKDTCRVMATTHEGVRIHYLTGLQHLPSWFEPGFAITKGQLVLGSSPAAIRSWSSAPAQSFAASDFAKRLSEAFPTGYTPVAYLNVTRLRDYLNRYGEQLIQDLSGPAKIDPAQLQRRIGLFLDVSGLVDQMAIGSYATESARHWILSVYPATKAE